MRVRPKRTTVEGARAHGANSARVSRESAGAASASTIGTIIDAANFLKPVSFLTPTSGLVRNAG